jgi:ankyrin repeat protein
MSVPLLVLLLVLAQAAAPASSSAGTDLLESAKLGQAVKVKELLAGGASVHAVDRRGFTPLMWACASGNLAVANLLLENGSVVDARARDGLTPLMLASANGFIEVTRALILRGADVNAARNGVTARQLAVARGYATVAALLEEAEGFGSKLLRAAAEGNDAGVRQLLASGAPVNVTNERGVNALMMAARTGSLGMMQSLLSRGADTTARDASGQGVFEWAEQSGITSKYVNAFLVDHGLSRGTARPPAAVESPQVKASLETLAGLLSRITPASPPLRTAQRRAATALQQLQTLSSNWPAESPDDYRDNLSGDVKALEAAIAAGNVDALVATTQAVAEDLEIKLEHCNRSGGKLGGSVTVRVRTVKGGDEITSWQVFYLPRVLEAAPNASPDLFPQLSSPTEDTLVPGRYVMWARDPVSTRVGERTVVKVGEGRKELVLDLPVPAAPTR